MYHIYVIEDDEDINRLLCKILQGGGYEVTSAYSGTEAKLRLEQKLPDLILLDLMLPGMGGEQITEYVRSERNSSIPILILSAKASVRDKVELMTMGADDYITKPFEPEEVLVRVMAALRRAGIQAEGQAGTEKMPVYTYKDLILKEQARRVEVCGQEIALTRHEYEILLILMRQPEKVFSREILYETVWKNGYYGEDNTVNVHVSNIRKKLAAAGGENEYIKTVWGIEFKMA